MCIRVCLHVCVCVPCMCRVCAWCPQRLYEGTRSHGTEVIDSRELPCRCQCSSLWAIFPAPGCKSKGRSNHVFSNIRLPVWLGYQWREEVETGVEQEWGQNTGIRWEGRQGIWPQTWAESCKGHPGACIVESLRNQWFSQWRRQTVYYNLPTCMIPSPVPSVSMPSSTWIFITVLMT